MSLLNLLYFIFPFRSALIQDWLNKLLHKWAHMNFPCYCYTQPLTSVFPLRHWASRPPCRSRFAGSASRRVPNGPDRKHASAPYQTYIGCSIASWVKADGRSQMFSPLSPSEVYVEDNPNGVGKSPLNWALFSFKLGLYSPLNLGIPPEKMAPCFAQQI